jgi:hypothetical protein
MTEAHSIDGQALDPSSFGETNPVTGVWQPKKYTGTYGTNGFYLNFSDNSNNTATTIGKDNSGNGNNWTPNNISVTAGVTYDSMLDVPTQWADGGNGRGNYAVWNPVSGLGGTFSNGNLQSVTGTSTQPTIGTFQLPTSGKWYWEVTVSTVSEMAVGVNTPPFANSTKTAYYRQGGASNGIYIEGSTNAYAAASYTNNDVIAVAFDADSSQISWYKNNVQQGGPYTLTSTANLFPYLVQVSGTGSCTGIANFGQRPFAYTPPTGFKALNTLNLPQPTILKGNQYFDATTYTGQNTSLSVTNSGAMQPNLLWLKKRSGGTDNILIDSVRGTDKNLVSNSTAAEDTTARLTSFDTGGFTLVGNLNNSNIAGSTYVGWQWKEGATQGFDIVTYTGTGSATTVAHSLGVTPSMIIVKERGNARFWFVNHISLSATQNLYLNGTDSVQSDSAFTSRSSTTFGVGSGVSTNGSGQTYVAYLFSEVAGFSRFGSYTGNGSADGPFVFCGFRPRWIMFKCSNSTESGNADWGIIDTSRSPYNFALQRVWANQSAAESNNSAYPIDILSNGFKLRNGDANFGHNTNGNTYIFAAFAENPFKNSLAR